MPAEISDIDKSMISNMMLTKSYKEIASTLGIEKADVGAVVTELTLLTNLVPYELKLKERWQGKNKARPAKKCRPGIDKISEPKQPTAAAKKRASDKAFNDSLKKQKQQAAKVQQQNLQAASTAKRRPSMYKTRRVD